MNRAMRRAGRTREQKKTRQLLWQAWLKDCANGGKRRWQTLVRKAGV